MSWTTRRSVRAAVWLTGTPAVPDRTLMYISPARFAVFVVVTMMYRDATAVIVNSVPASLYTLSNVKLSFDPWNVRFAVSQAAGMWIAERTPLSRYTDGLNDAPFAITTGMMALPIGIPLGEKIRFADLGGGEPGRPPRR